MENKDEIKRRINLVREYMKSNGYGAAIIGSSDPHNSEYPAPHWQARQWLSGFDGSAGTLVVGTTRAALWTDSRYFIAAAQQLEGTGIELMKDGLPDTMTIMDFILQDMGDCHRAVADGNFISHTEYSSIAQADKAGILECEDNLVDSIWTEGRPSFPTDSIFVHPIEYAGETLESKLESIRRDLQKSGRGICLMNDSSEIAWTLNLRSQAPFNPTFPAFLVVGSDFCFLYVKAENLADGVAEYLKKGGIEIKAYEDFSAEAWGNHPCHNTITMADTASAYQGECLSEHIESSPVAMFRAVKNDAEIRGFHNAMLRDGRALVRFRRWLDEAVPLGGETEMSVDAKLTALRAEEEGFKGLSFATIAGYGAHGAIVHYEATPQSDAALKPEGLLLLDSGAQYVDGTTDITRTIALGPVTEEEKRVYTLVLKGHIALSRCRFPVGTYGLELDLAARYAMWQEGYDFGHGTGHGVGSYLCVHEGPQQIRKNLRACTQVPFEQGMTITNEPGIYVEGRFGVRIENTMLTVDGGSTDFGKFLRFEPLTLCPIDMNPIDFSMLTNEELNWLNQYHLTVRHKLMPLLDDEADRQWLERATQTV